MNRPSTGWILAHNLVLSILVVVPVGEIQARSDPGSAVGEARTAFPRARTLIARLRHATVEVNREAEVPPQVAAKAPEASASNPRPTVSASASRPIPRPTATPARDDPVRRAQAASGEMRRPFGPGVAPPIPVGSLPTSLAPAVGGQSISLQTALYGTLTSNPDLVILRQGSPTVPSAEAVEVARRFPTTLNPTLWIDFRPINLIPPDPFTTPGSGTGGGGGSRQGPYYHWGKPYIYMSLRQPVELGHQTTHRYHIAKAAFEQQNWNVVQAEILALVQTYRFFETAAYRREKYQIAKELADFNERILKTLERRLEANQVPAADVVLARVESRATRQMVKAAQQDYVTALTDLRNQIGIPESAGAAEPLGAFTLPPYIPSVSEEEMIQTALQNRPDIRAARAMVAGTKAAENLAKGDRIPSPIIGPEYSLDEAGLQYVGLVYITPIPILNGGGPLVRQRQAEHHRAHLALQQVQQRAVAQIRSAVAKWNGASELVKETAGLTEELARQVDGLERLFDEGQTDLTRLMQARQRLIQLKNSEIDAIWAATQAQSDLLLALGTPSLIQGMLGQAETAANASEAAPVPPSASGASPFRSTPETPSTKPTDPPRS